jgi:hypothetical protein
MPRSKTHFAYWIDGRGLLHGYPSKERLPPVPHKTGDPTSSDWKERLRPNDVAEVQDVHGWRARLEGEQGARCIIGFRDRQGFRWEREVGLNDFVSQADAAQLLGVPLMRVNRWIRARELKSSKRQGYSVVRVKDLYRLALKLDLEVPRGHRRVIVGSGEDD